MKNLIRHRNQILFGFLIVLLGLSKSWFMTAEPTTDINLASSTTAATATDDDDSTTDPDAAAATSSTDATKPGRKDGIGKKPSASTTLLSQAQVNSCIQRAKTTQAKAACSSQKVKKPIVKAKEGIGVTKPTTPAAAAAPAKPDAVTIEKAKASTDKLLAGMKTLPLNQTITATQSGTKVSYQITDVGTSVSTGKALVSTDSGMQVQDVQTTSIVATIKCMTCDGAEETITSNATDIGSLIKDINTQLIASAKEDADAKKKELALEKAQKDCEKDEEGKKMSDIDQMTCHVRQDMADNDRDDRLDSLRGDVESDILDMIQDGPSGVKKAKKYLKAIRNEVGSDSESKRYIDELSKFASKYSQVATLARDASLSGNVATRYADAAQITQIEAQYVQGGLHSPGTQDYIDQFSGILKTYAQSAVNNPYQAYNSFYNNGGLSGTNGLTNSALGLNGMNGLNTGLNGINGLNGRPNGGAPYGFQVSNYGPGGTLNAPANYLNQNNNSLLNQNLVPFGLQQQAARPQFGPGYTTGGTQMPLFN
jgi:hypothetical protein